jgi:hypothetical protein
MTGAQSHRIRRAKTLSRGPIFPRPLHRPALKFEAVSKKILAPISQAEIEARISGHLDELLELWWA